MLLITWDRKNNLKTSQLRHLALNHRLVGGEKGTYDVLCPYPTIDDKAIDTTNDTDLSEVLTQLAITSAIGIGDYTDDEDDEKTLLDIFGKEIKKHLS